MNWKVAVTLLIILTATAITTTTTYLNTPKPTHSQLETPETKTINRSLILYGEPVDGPGGPH